MLAAGHPCALSSKRGCAISMHVEHRCADFMVDHHGFRIIASRARPVIHTQRVRFVAGHITVSCKVHTVLALALPPIVPTVQWP
jgi:hypothetical protein